jgi:hypothetical protein
MKITGSIMGRYIFGTATFLFVVISAYLKYLNYRQEKEAGRLGVRILFRFKWTIIDDYDPRCTAELGHAYRLTNLLATANLTAFVAMAVLTREVDW